MDFPHTQATIPGSNNASNADFLFTLGLAKVNEEVEEAKGEGAGEVVGEVFLIHEAEVFKVGGDDVVGGGAGRRGKAVEGKEFKEADEEEVGKEAVDDEVGNEPTNDEDAEREAVEADEGREAVDEEEGRDIEDKDDDEVECDRDGEGEEVNAGEGDGEGEGDMASVFPSSGIFPPHSEQNFLHPMNDLRHLGQV